MARIRSVHPGLASDEAYMQMSMAAKAAWPILWTECDDHGVFEWKPIVLKARIFPADNVDFAMVLQEYVELGCIEKAEIDGKPLGFVRNFCRFQRPKKPSYRHTLPGEQEKFVGLKEVDLPTSSPPVPHQFPTLTEIPPQRKEEGGRRDREEVVPSLRSGASPRDDDPSKELYRLGRETLGSNSGGLIRKFIDATGSPGEALAILRQTIADVDDAAARRSYLMAIVKGRERSGELTLVEQGVAW